MALAMLLAAAGASAHAQLQPEDAVRVEDVARQAGRIRRDGEVVAACSRSADCDDGLPCTLDLCSQGDCIHLSVPDCVACESTVVCSAADLVFLMDTSGSMRDEAAAICASIEGIVADLADRGITVFPRVLGITQQPGIGFTCISGTVVGLLGGTVPGDADACPFPGSVSSYESWGPATAIVAARYPWGFGTTRIIIPVSDEGPCDGSLPEGCNDPGEDRDAIENAIDFAAANGVIISPIVGTGADPCTITLAQRAADATQGRLMQTKEPKLDIADAIRRIIVNDCVVNDRCDDGQPCTADDRCFDRVCRGTPIVGCRLCVSGTDCEDGSVCTVDVCKSGACTRTPTYDLATECCDPRSGSLQAIDDGDPCTRDQCDESTGIVGYFPAAQGTACDDVRGCTGLDVCDGVGNCVGADINGISCTAHADCGSGVCNPNTGRCVCEERAFLCLGVDPPQRTGASCFAVDEHIMARINLVGTNVAVSGIRFQLSYDPGKLEAIRVVSGAEADLESPFSLFASQPVIDRSAGVVVGEVHVPPSKAGIFEPTVLAGIEFRAAQGCETDLGFGSVDLQQTRVFGGIARQPVAFSVSCAAEQMTISSGPPRFTCPTSTSVPADAGQPTAVINWAQPTASSPCDGSLTPICRLVSTTGPDVRTLVQRGGEFPMGRYTFECIAVDSCGMQSQCAWNVEVRREHILQVDLQLSPPFARGPVDRCIVFELYSDTMHEPITVETTVSFGGLFAFPGRADDFIITIPIPEQYPFQYLCATAHDPRHTLRSRTALDIVDGRYMATFTGDPMFGGNWLIGGNVNGDGVIDALDGQIVIEHYLWVVDPDTPCGTLGFHADFDGNGRVDLDDYNAVQRSLLKTDSTVPPCD